MQMHKHVKNKSKSPQTKPITRISHSQPSTAQEWAITQLLKELGLSYAHPWTVHFPDRYIAFDFFIDRHLVLECSFSQNCPSKARTWLRSKITMINNRFRILKFFMIPPPFTIMLLEGAQFSLDDLDPIIDPLDFTDQLFTSLDELTEFFHHWKAMFAISFDPLTVPKPPSRRTIQ
jgi:hypothetical protein